MSKTLSICQNNIKRDILGKEIPNLHDLDLSM